MNLLQQLEKMYQMAVWDSRGRMYMPLFYKNKVVVYTRTGPALEACMNTHNVGV